MTAHTATLTLIALAATSIALLLACRTRPRGRYVLRGRDEQGGE